MHRRIAAALLLGASQAALAAQPSFLIVVADDLAYADIGAFGGEIETPNLDRLAREGNRLDNFHAGATCSPSRAMLLTGTDAHRAGLGTMSELVTPSQRGRPAYRGTLGPDTRTIAEWLAPAGYRTLLSGKWHLGSGGPTARGFQSSFAMMEAGHHHFGADAGHGAIYQDDGRTVERLPADFYSTTAFADRMIADLKATPRDVPVFAVLAFTAPHWPLMAPPAAIAAQRGRYDAGYEALRAARIARQKALGLVPADAEAAPMELPPGSRWAELSPEARAQASRRMEIHAAMVSELDKALGRVLAELERSGRADETVILFLSDNGADAVDLERAARAYMQGNPGGPGGGGANPFASFITSADNRLENLGSGTSYAAYGPGWAQAGGGLLRLWKAFPTEGGMRVPAILRVPGARPGPVSASLDIRDVAPTLLDLAGIDPAKRPDGVQPITGLSWRPLVEGRATEVRGGDDIVPHELFGARSLRQGSWKLLDVGDGRWRLHDLAADPGETRDLAAEKQPLSMGMAARWDAWAKEVGVALPDRPIPMLMRPPAQKGDAR